MSNTSYYLYQKYIKYGSQDWIPVYPAEYAISGDAGQTPVIKQENDPNCGYYQHQYRWYTLPITEDFVCSGGNKYYKEVYQVSYDNGFNWENVVPEQTRQGSLYESGSSDCIEYRWVNMDISTDWICEGTTKYYKQKKQKSMDGGVTWYDVVPAEYQKGELYEEHSDDCNIYLKQYLTFIPTTGSSTFTFSGNSVSYSLDSGLTWTTLANNTPSPSVNAGEKIMWKGELTPSPSYPNFPWGVGSFSSSNKFDVEGNIMSLLYGDNFVGKTDLTGKIYSFAYLFTYCTNVVSAENLVLPATTLAEGSYFSMFNDCTSLTTAPVLPATTLTKLCYWSMFYGCTSLTSAPELPATTLADSCYRLMFSNCTSLTKAPELSATTLVDYCYYSMFAGCTGLTTAPSILPATTLVNRCYMWMFQDCASLTTAPELPATTLVDYCYFSMFYGCANLNNITCLATNISASSCTTNWVNGVANSGTFTKASSMTSWTTGNNGIPNNWTVQNYS